MLENIRFIHFHDQVFHAGKNFGNKVEVKKHDGLKIQFSPEERRFYISYQGRIGKIPEASAFIWEPEGPVAIPEIKNEHHTEDRSKRSKAQVSTPQSHVFEGRGQGLK